MQREANAFNNAMHKKYAKYIKGLNQMLGRYAGGAAIRFQTNQTLCTTCTDVSTF